jgi:hypothetical protein
VKPVLELSSLVAETTVACALAAYGTVRASAEDLPALRQMAGPFGGPLPPSFLKHSDEQTVVGLAAVFQAIRRFGMPEGSFREWGVVAGPRLFGRLAVAHALQRFAAEGAWGVSPHLIPHRSLHSLSGSISQALEIHGPNFGVSGGPDCASETMLAAAALLAEGQVPGTWVILTGWFPEPHLEKPGLPCLPGLRPSGSVYGAVALALTTVVPDWDGSLLQITPSGADWNHDTIPEIDTTLPPFTVKMLLEELATDNLAPAAWRLACGGWLECERVASCAENRL